MAHFLGIVHLQGVVPDWEKKVVDSNKPGTNGLTIVLGTIPVGAGLVIGLGSC